MDISCRFAVMLTELRIKNYAIIDDLQIHFSGGLNIITGETGAGKSIIIGALGLLLGDRADSAVLINKEKKSVAEALFNAPGKNVQQFLASLDLEPSAEVILRREISTSGKSRAFINDTPVTLNQLGTFGTLLVDLHRQFDTLAVNNAVFQQDVLDAFAGTQEEAVAYDVLYRRWQKIKSEWKDLLEQQQQIQKEADYNRFQYTELEEAAFADGELEETEAALRLMNNAEGIKAALEAAAFTLKEGETPVVQQLKSVLSQLGVFGNVHSGLESLLERLKQAQIELQDIAGEINFISNDIQYDPQKAAQLNERLSLGYRLQKKHGAGSTAELLAIQADLEQKLESEFTLAAGILEKENECDRLEKEIKRVAVVLSEARKKKAPVLEKKINELLARVGMPNAQLRVDIGKKAEPDAGGYDNIEFLFNANLPAGKEKGREHFQSLRKVASGGELSRLMLCIKSIIAEKADLPTMIFDEIDTGISGEAARQVGVLMKELAASRQVFSITHQPQIAGKADAHYYVYKQIDGDLIKTNIRELSKDERVVAIAKMMSGEKPTAAALENAKELVGN